MDLVNCHAFLVMLPVAERPELPCEGDFEDKRIDSFPAVASALASLSGWLDDAEDDDVVPAVKHGAALLSSEIITLDDVRAEVVRVIQAIIADGDREEAAQRERRRTARGQRKGQR